MKKILIFNSIHDVLKVEELLSKENIESELIPVPKNISSNCGMALLINGNQEKDIINLININNINLIKIVNE